VDCDAGVENICVNEPGPELPGPELLGPELPYPELIAGSAGGNAIGGGGGAEAGVGPPPDVA
jgi:hypothetical protein